MGKCIQFGGAMFSNWSNCELRHSCKWNPRHNAVSDVHNKKPSEFQRDLYLLMTTNLVINQVFQRVLKWAILKRFPSSGSDSCYFRSYQSKLTPAFLRANFRTFSHSLSSVNSSTTLVIEEFKILQESCEKSCKIMHSSSIFLARILQELNSSCKILARIEFFLQESRKIFYYSCKNLAKF